MKARLDRHARREKARHQLDWINDVPPDTPIIATDNGGRIGWFIEADEKPHPDALEVWSGVHPAPRYRLAGGGFSDLPDPLVDDWPNPRWVSVQGIDSIFDEVPDRSYGTRWGYTGWQWVPQTQWGKFLGHVAHGLAMRYPLRHVLAFAAHMHRARKAAAAAATEEPR